MEDKSRINAVRRLYFEAFTLMTANLRSQVERTDDDKPRKLSLPEREARRQQVIPKLQGLDLEGVHEVSHALVDTCVHMREESLQHIPWEKCTSRAEEIAGDKTKPEWKADAQGVIREMPGQNDARSSAHTDLQLYNLLTRRGIACEMGRLMQYTTHQMLTTRLLQDLHEAPPPGYQRVSYTQVRAADVKAWQLLARATQSGIVDVADGRTSVDEAMPRILADSRFTMLLLPKPAPARGDGQPPFKRTRGGQAVRAKGQGKQQDWAAPAGKGKQQAWAPPVGNGGKGNKGKNKGKRKGKGQPRDTGGRSAQSRPTRKEKQIDPDNPFAAALMGLKNKD